MEELGSLSREIQLIKYVAQEQALYNPKHEFYRNTVRKDMKWVEIGAAIGWTELQCKAKWKAFRDQFCRELKRSKVNPKATVKWKYFKYLEFMRPYALSRNYRPRYVPNNTTNNVNMKNVSADADDQKKNLTAAIITADYNLLQNIKMEPKSQQDDQQQQANFVNDCAVMTSIACVSTSEHNVKNDAMVVVPAEQLQNLNDVLQQQQQKQHVENWSFHHQLQNQQQNVTHNYNHNDNNGNNNNNIMNSKNIDQTSNSSADYALLHNAIADCVAIAAAAEAEAKADASQLLHQSQIQQQHLQLKAQQQQEIYLFQTPMAPPTTSSDEDDDPIHKFLNIENYFEKELIALVQSEDILYNSYHPHYRNAKRKLNVWADIARKSKKTVKQCRLKWKALRDQYIREHKRLRNSMNIENIPRWKHYDALNFLHNFIKHKSENEEKKIFQIFKGQNLNNAESIEQNQIKAETQQQRQQNVQQELDLHPAFIGLSNALVEHQRQQNPHQYHDEMKSTVTISSTSSIATSINDVQATGTSLIDIDDNQSNTDDDYNAIDIDNYINGDGGSDNIVMDHCNANDDDSIGNGNGDPRKDNNDIQNYNQTHRSNCSIINSGITDGVLNQSTTQSEVDSLSPSDFHKLKDIVSPVNSPVTLLSISSSQEQQQLCQQSQKNSQKQQKQSQHHHQQHQRHENNENDHVLQVVSLSCDDVVVLNESNAAQLGFIVPSSSPTTSSNVITASSPSITPKTSSKTALTLPQRNITEQTSNSPTSTVVTDGTLTTLSTENANVFYNNSNNKNTNHNSNNMTIPNTTVNDVENVFSSMATCADLAANFDDCSTPTLPTSQLTLSLHSGTAADADTVMAPITSPSTSNSNLLLTTNILNPPIVIATSTATLTTTTTSTSKTTSSHTSTAAMLSTYTNTITNDDDEVGVFFKAIAMKIRSVNLTPIEFTDLQIEVLRVINQSLRKN